jgi:hypothetical protein
MKCKLCPNRVEYPKTQKLLCGACWGKPYPITTICRTDLEEHFGLKAIAQFKDEDMVTLADRMGEGYVADSFWFDMVMIGEEILKRK